MRVLLAAVAAISVSATSVLAANGECRSVENDLDRLACYDKESGRTPTTTAVPTASEWKVETKTSDFEDTNDIYLSVASKEPVACSMFGAHQTATLFVRCQENTTSVFIATNCHLASGVYDYGKVDVRRDDKKAVTVSMEESTDNKALGFWTGNKAIAFLHSQVLGGQTLKMRFTPFNQSPVTAEFNISGVDDAIKPLRERCGW